MWSALQSCVFLSRCQAELWKAQAGLSCLTWQRERRRWFLLAAGQSSEQREPSERGSPAAPWEKSGLITLRFGEWKAEWCAKEPAQLTICKTHTLLSSLGLPLQGRTEPCFEVTLEHKWRDVQAQVRMRSSGICPWEIKVSYWYFEYVLC